MKPLSLLVAGFVFAGTTVAHAADDLPKAAAEALHRGVEFFHQKVAKHGGYVYLYSDDLKKSEGEGKTGPDTVWVQPPGTPAVGSALIEAYRRTNDQACLAAAKDAGEALIQGQYRSGGWSNSIDFDPAVRAKTAYRVDQPLSKKRQFNVSTFDDDKTPAALRCLMQLDQALGFKDDRVHEATTFALDSVLKVQFPNGAWAQGFEAVPDPAKHPVLKASYPDDWPRKHPGGDYWWFYTFNDNNISRMIETMLLADDIYADPRYRAAALKAGDFILLAQMPDPQPAWAQQYNFEMHPVWARKFEPTSISGGESQQLIGTLMDLYVASGDKKYLEPIPRALAYLKKSQLPDGRLARFYELKTNKPLYFVKDTYELTYSDVNLPTHYGFQVSSNLDKLQQRYDEVSRWTPAKVQAEREKKPGVSKGSSLEKRVQQIIAAQDSRGAWVEDGKFKHHGKGDGTTRVISSATFIKNVDALSQYLAAVRAAK
ncbi:MAG TPA: pectate lyase [Planctomycetaceae bacterium]|nr:pectate lyase [Planctomycetaceae bacterium]